MIAFDIQAVQSRSHGERGIARFCLELALAIERRDANHVDRYLVNPDRPIPATLEPLVRTGKVIRSDELPPERLRLLHIGSPVELDIPVEHIVTGRPELMVANLYDLIPLVFADHYLSDVRTSARYRTRLGVYSSADLVLADSRSAADDAVAHLGVDPERCRVIGAGASSSFRPAAGGRSAAMQVVEAAVPAIRPGFVMLPSGIDWRKNIEGVVRAYGRLPEDVRRSHQLVLVCRVDDRERADLAALAAEVGCASTFVMTGYVSDEVLVALNQAAHLVVFPSKYEGFGLPVLEARQCGAPVICGDNSSLRELVPDPAARFDAGDDESIADALARALGDPVFHERLRQATIPPFTWDRAAELTIAGHRDLLTGARPISMMRDQRPTIAYVSPVPPVESGIARYTFHLLEALREFAQVRAFCDQELSSASVPWGVDLSPLHDLVPLCAAGRFDHVVVALGNNAVHRTSLDVLAQVRAHVHLHDVRLTNCYADERWPEVIARQYPGRFSEAELAATPAAWSSTVMSKSIFLLSDVARYALSVMTHSSYASTLVDLDTGRHAVDIGPIAFRPRSPGRRPEPGLVISLGVVSTAKQSLKLAAAAEVLRARGSDAQVAFVGDGAEILGTTGPNVHTTGWASDAVYEDHLMRASVAVQLRDASNGESSAAVADCLSAGVPVVVTDIGSFGELPADVVVRVPRDIDAAELADVVQSLLDDPERRERLSAAGVAFAQQNTFRDAAKRLFDAVTGAARTEEHAA